MNLLVLYDIATNKVRSKIADACLDFNLQRIQYSAYLGQIDPAWRPELEARLQKILGEEKGRIHIVSLDKRAMKSLLKIGVGLD